MNDNRSYWYSKNSKSRRVEYDIIVDWVSKGSKVLDLGSGDGSLLRLLKTKKRTDGIGIEISESGVSAAKDKGVKSIVGRIDIELPFEKKEFDYAICNVTLQMVMYPEVLMKEMQRVSKKQIITFPNFAFIPNRIDLLLNGVMPRVMIPGYSWFSTGHIHQLSIRDFKNFCKQNNFKILETRHIGPATLLSIPANLLVKILPNLFASTGAFLLEEMK